MKRRLWGSFLVLLLAACSSSPVDLPQTTSTFSFTVDPAAQTVNLVSAPAALSIQAEDRSRVLVPGEDLSLESYTFVFLPGNVLTIDAVFKNVSDQTFTNLSFSRGAGSSNVVNSTEPDVVATLAPGASTGPLRFEVQHRGQSFSYEVEATATVETGGADCADPVTIPDEVLRQAVRDALNKPEGDITCADMASLTELRQRGRQGENGIPNRFVENLEGLQYAVNLTTLQLMGNLALNDVTLLSTLTKLTDLDLSGNRIGDIGPLSTLVNLTRLDLGFNLNIEDVSPLSNLTGLETLVLNINQIADIAPLSGLVNLRRLDLGTNFVADLSPLVTNTGVGNDDDRLDLRFNCLDVSPGSPTLEAVDVLESRNPDVQNVFLGTQRESDEDCGRLPPPPPTEECSDPITIPDFSLELSVRAELQKPEGDITCADMATLTQVIVGNYENGEDNDVAFSLEGIEFAINLKKFEFSIATDEVDSSYLVPLGSLTSLTELVIKNENYRFLEDLPDLDFSLLGGLTNLTKLFLPPARVSDIGFISNLTELTYLGLVASEVNDFSPLANLTSLKELFLRSGDLEGKSTQISDISILSNLTNLTDLGLEGNNISDISVLSGLTDLVNLDLRFNRITDLTAISGLTNLVNLFLYNNIISDISPLVTNPGLGDGNDQIGLRENCFSVTPGSEALQDIMVLEDRNPDVENVYFSSQTSARCNP